MNIKHVGLSTILALGISSAVTATPIQIDFNATVLNFTDEFNKVFLGNVSVGDAATGRFVFDDDVAHSLLQENNGSGTQYNDPLFKTPWIDAYITVNGRTYTTDLPSNLLDIRHSDIIHIANWDVDHVYIGSGSTGDIDNNPDNGNLSSYLVLEGMDLEGNSLNTIDVRDIADFAHVFDRVLFGRHDPFDGGAGGGFEATVNSLTVTRLDQPPTAVSEPAVPMLLATGIIGLVCQRIFFKKKSAAHSREPQNRRRQTAGWHPR